MDSYPVKQSSEEEEELCGVAVPYFYSTFKSDKTSEITRVLMRDFNGIKEMDESVIAAIMNFNHHLGLGNLDEAYKSIL